MTTIPFRSIIQKDSNYSAGRKLLNIQQIIELEL